MLSHIDQPGPKHKEFLSKRDPFIIKFRSRSVAGRTVTAQNRVTTVELSHPATADETHMETPELSHMREDTHLDNDDARTQCYQELCALRTQVWLYSYSRSL